MRVAVRVSPITRLIRGRNLVRAFGGVKPPQEAIHSQSAPESTGQTHTIILPFYDLIANIGAEEFGRIELVSYALKPEGEEAASRDWTDGAHQSKAL